MTTIAYFKNLWDVTLSSTGRFTAATDYLLFSLGDMQLKENIKKSWEIPAPGEG